MIVNNLKALTRYENLQGSDQGQPQPKAATSIVLKINIDKRVSSFEETLLLTMLKAFRVEFQLDTTRVPTFRGCRLC
jgi:hypothetical protein